MTAQTSTARQRTKPPAASEAARKRIARAVANEIPEIGECLNPARRAACKDDLRQFCEVYFADRFNWEWSTDHLELIHAIRHCIVNGGLYLVVCPRGMGKTSLLEVASVWATVYGHRRYIVPVCATGEDAADFLNSIKAIWESNGTLAADFPEIAEPIRAADGISLRASRQTHKGKRTHLEYSATCIAYPWIDGIDMPGRGACIEPRSITGRIRGMKRTLPDGKVQRPDFVLPDDIQTDESARSTSQVKHRLGSLNTSVLGLAGPGSKIAGIMLGTIIQKGDAVDQLLHDDKYHAWGGRRMQLVYRWPDAQDTLWREYADIRRKAAEFTDPADKEAVYAEAAAFYAERREAMDKGALVQWPERKYPGELSALQHAENLLIDRGREAFDSEYQNDPQASDENASPLTVNGIMARINRQRHWYMPTAVEYVAGKIDVGDSRLHLTIIASEPNGTPYLIHRQTWPENGNQTLEDLYPKVSAEARIYAALEDLATKAILPERQRADGTAMKVQRLHVDKGHRPRLIERWCRQGVAKGIAHPEGGAKTGHLDAPLNKWRQRPGERRGDGWLIQPASNGIRGVIVDSHQWKSYLSDRLQTPLGADGALTLYGDNPEAHRELAEHCALAEYPTAVGIGGTERMVWRPRPGSPPNHYFDCLYGSFVALSILGCQLKAGGEAPRKRRKQFRAHVSIT